MTLVLLVYNTGNCNIRLYSPDRVCVLLDLTTHTPENLHVVIRGVEEERGEGGGEKLEKVTIENQVLHV